MEANQGRESALHCPPIHAQEPHITSCFSTAHHNNGFVNLSRQVCGRHGIYTDGNKDHNTYGRQFEKKKLHVSMWVGICSHSCLSLSVCVCAVFCFPDEIRFWPH